MKKKDIEEITSCLQEKLECYCEDEDDEEFSSSSDSSDSSDYVEEVISILAKNGRPDLIQFIRNKFN